MDRLARTACGLNKSPFKIIDRLDGFSGVTLCRMFEGSLGFDSMDRQSALIQWAVKEPFQAWLGLHRSENTLKSSIDRQEITIEGDTGSVDPFDRGARFANKRPHQFTRIVQGAQCCNLVV